MTVVLPTRSKRSVDKPWVDKTTMNQNNPKNFKVSPNFLYLIMKLNIVLKKLNFIMLNPDSCLHILNAAPDQDGG